IAAALRIGAAAPLRAGCGLVGGKAVGGGTALRLLGERILRRLALRQRVGRGGGPAFLLLVPLGLRLLLLLVALHLALGHAGVLSVRGARRPRRAGWRSVFRREAWAQDAARTLAADRSPHERSDMRGSRAAARIPDFAALIRATILHEIVITFRIVV